MKNILIAILTLAVLGGIIFFAGREKSEVAVGKTYTSEEFGIQFSYPEDYFIGFEDEFEGERSQKFVVLAEDTPENRRVFSGEEPGREGPPTITIAIYQNNLDNYTAESFIKNTSFSNFKLSDGVLTEDNIGGVTGFRYNATGLYENKNAVVATPEFVYMFTVFYLTPEDKILSDFEKLLQSVEFK